MSASSGSSGGRTTYKEQIHVQGELGTKTYRRHDNPELGYGDIAFVAQFDGVVDFHNDAIVGPVSVGETVADKFREAVEDRVDNIEFHDFKDN